MGAENKYDLKLSPNYNPDGNSTNKNELSMCRKLSSTSSSSLNSNGALEPTTGSFQLSQIVPSSTSRTSQSKSSAITTTTDSLAAKGSQMSACSIYSNRKCSSTSSLVSDQPPSKLVACAGKQASSTDNLKETEKKTLTRAKGDISLAGESDYSCGGFSNVALSPTQEEEDEDELMGRVENGSYRSSESSDKCCNTIGLSGKTDGSLIGSDFSSNGLAANGLATNGLATSKLDTNSDLASTEPVREDEQNKENAMSVSVPNLSLNGDDVSAMINETEATAANLMEAFSSLSRRSSNNNSSLNATNGQNGLNNNNLNYNNSFNSSNNQLCNSLVRLALASNFPELIAELLNELASTESCSDILANQQLLSTAQSYPSLSESGSSTTMTLSEARRNFNTQPVSGNSSGFTLSTSSELFENCTPSLLSGIEDELDAGDDNDDDLDEENDEYDYVSLMDESSSSSYDHKNKRKNNWDDDYVLKRSSAELLPAFDPRPGRTNLNQTVDLEIQEPSNSTGSFVKKRKESTVSLNSKSASTKLLLSFKMTTYTNKEVEIDLVNPNWSIFSALQCLSAAASNNKQEKLRRVWDSVYTVCYRETKDDELEDRNLPIHKAAIRTTSNAEMEEVLNVAELTDQSFKSLKDVLVLLKLLYSQATQSNEQASLTSFADQEPSFDLLREEYISKKITNKLMQQIQDPLVLTSASLPDWCANLMYRYPMLFPFEIRQMFFQSTAFGTSRSIVWLQNQRDLILERQHGPSPRREDPHEFRLGRLLHERVKVPRHGLLAWATEVMRVTSKKKSILEVEFRDEEGTGLGPTLEFYALVAAELQAKKLKMWLCNDELIMNYDALLPNATIDQTPDYYVNHPAGLFPAPLDQNHKNIAEICQLFEFLGVYIAKAFQDNRLVDLPLSLSFLKLFSHHHTDLRAPTNETGSLLTDCKQSTLNLLIDKLKAMPLSDEEQLIKSRSAIEKEARCKLESQQAKSSWIKGVLNEADFQQLFPAQGNFLGQLRELSISKQRILLNASLSLDEKQNQINNLYLPVSTGGAVRLEELGLTFQYLPTSKVYEFDAVNLKVNGDLEEVNMANFEEYYELLLDFCLHTGLRRQLDAFKSKDFFV